MTTTPPRRSRLTTDLPAEVRRRLRLIAPHRDVTIREYVLTAASDPVLENYGTMRRTRPMTISSASREQGDAVLVRFVFSDETGAKRRPAVVLSTSQYHQGRQEAIVAAITGNVQRLLEV